MQQLKAGQPWTMVYSNNALIGLEYEIDANERLVVSMTDSGYEFRREVIPYEIETKTVSGVIERRPVRLHDTGWRKRGAGPAAGQHLRL